MTKPIIFTVMLLGVFSLASYAIPQLINYQGQLTDNSGVPLDTTMEMTFKLHSDSTAGTLLWTEAQPSVTVANGLFQLNQGQVTVLPDVVFNQPQVWLGITAGSDTEMLPRAHVVSTAYSYRVSTVDSATGGTETEEDAEGCVFRVGKCGG